MADSKALETARKKVEETASKVWAIFRSLEALDPLVKGTESHQKRVRYVKDTLKVAREVKYDVSLRMVSLNRDIDKLRVKSNSKGVGETDTNGEVEDKGKEKDRGETSVNSTEKTREHRTGRMEVLELWLDECGKWNVKLGNAIEKWKEELNLLERGV